VSDARFRVAVQPGEGIVARFGSAVLVADAAGGAEPFTTAVVDELDACGGELTDALAWRLAAQLTAAPETAPAFGLVFVQDAGYRVFLHGRVRALVGGEQRLSGAQALTWVDALIEPSGGPLALTLVEAGDVMTDARSDLRLGTMSGSGLVLTPSGVPQPAPVLEAQPEPEPEREPEPEPEPEPQPRPLPEPAPPQPPARPSAGLATVTAETEYVPVVVDHEPKRTDELPSAGSAPAADRTRKTVALRDSLTGLMSDDGVRTPLDRPYVFGREPQQDPSVADGSASPIRLSDPEQLISRVQAYLFVDGDRVTVQDAHSANGTFVAAPGASDWQRLDEEPVDLPVGWSIRMGRRVFTHYGL
jgi:hypothetical protein